MGVFVYLCVVLFVWMCLYVSEEKEDEGCFAHREEREKMNEINKIIVYKVTVTVYICTATIANV